MKKSAVTIILMFFCLAPLSNVTWSAQHQKPSLAHSTDAKTVKATTATAPKIEISADDKIAVYTLWLAVFTGLLVFVSVVQWIFLWRTDRIARISADAAKMSADAAKKSADILAQSERAVVISVMEDNKIKELLKGSVLYNNSPGMADSSVEFKGGIDYHLQNHGKTLAIITEVSHRVIISEALPTQPDYSKNATFRNPMIGAGETTESFTCPFPKNIKKGETDDVVARRKSIWFFGRVRFNDIFGIEHEHCFVWRYHHDKEKFRPHYEGGEYNKTM